MNDRVALASLSIQDQTLVNSQINRLCLKRYQLIISTKMTMDAIGCHIDSAHRYNNLDSLSALLAKKKIARSDV